MCDCINLYSEALKESGKNTQLDIPICFDRESHNLNADRVAIAVCKADSRKHEKPLVVFANYCPFCGVKYLDSRAEENKESLESRKESKIK